MKKILLYSILILGVIVLGCKKDEDTPDRYDNPFITFVNTDGTFDQNYLYAEFTELDNVILRITAKGIAELDVAVLNNPMGTPAVPNTSLGKVVFSSDLATFTKTLADIGIGADGDAVTLFFTTTYEGKQIYKKFDVGVISPLTFDVPLDADGDPLTIHHDTVVMNFTYAISTVNAVVDSVAVYSAIDTVGAPEYRMTMAGGWDVSGGDIPIKGNNYNIDDPVVYTVKAYSGALVSVATASVVIEP